MFIRILRGNVYNNGNFIFFIPESLAKYPNLQAYVDRIESLPAMKKFLASPERIPWPILGPIATIWGFNKEDDSDKVLSTSDNTPTLLE